MTMLGMLSAINSYAYEKNVVNACVKISIYNFNSHHHSEKGVPKLYIYATRLKV